MPISIRRPKIPSRFQLSITEIVWSRALRIEARESTIPSRILFSRNFIGAATSDIAWRERVWAFPSPKRSSRRTAERSASPANAATVRYFRLRCPSSAAAPWPDFMTSATILIVDDEPQIRRVMRTTLTSQGYAVIEAKSGEEALEKLRAE